MILQVLNTATNLPKLALSFDETDTPTVYETHLRDDLKAGINVTPFPELQKKDPLLTTRPLVLKEIDPEGTTYYRHVVALPTKNATPAEKAFFKEVFIKWYETYLSHHGYKIKMRDALEPLGPSSGDNPRLKIIKV